MRRLGTVTLIDVDGHGVAASSAMEQMTGVEALAVAKVIEEVARDMRAHLADHIGQVCGHDDK